MRNVKPKFLRRHGEHGECTQTRTLLADNNPLSHSSHVRARIPAQPGYVQLSSVDELLLPLPALQRAGLLDPDKEHFAQRGRRARSIRRTVRPRFLLKEASHHRPTHRQVTISVVWSPEPRPRSCRSKAISTTDNGYYHLMPKLRHDFR